MPEQGLQKLRKRKEAIEWLLARSKLHQEVDVAVGTRLVPQHGAEESEAPHTEAKHLSGGVPEALSYLLAGEDVRGLGRRPAIGDDLTAPQGIRDGYAVVDGQLYLGRKAEAVLREGRAGPGTALM
jgi:hypothetical protein